MNARSLLFATILVSAGGQADDIPLETLEPLPAPVANNAVLALPGPQGPTLLSVLGLGEGKGHGDVHAHSYLRAPGDDSWRRGEDAPGGGRLAGVAVTANGEGWLFGGYTVAADGEEQSVPGVYRWTDGWNLVTDMPVPVDDAVALVYRDRWIYLVSGWHDLGNVNLVQILDTETLSWSQGTAFPGASVFGHAGGLSGQRLAVCGGVAIDYPASGDPRRFVPGGECWAGDIDPDNHRRIAWRPLPDPPVGERYRMAAAADGQGRVVFVGGSENPYNYSGVGYDGVPSEPEATVWSLDLDSLAWTRHGDLAEPSMDHRGLLVLDDAYWLLGGMLAGQRVTDRVVRFRLD